MRVSSPLLRSARGRALAAALLVLVSACARPEAPARGAILISIDTLRADHLGCYGHALPTSPALDAFAAQGTLFEDAVTTSPWTLPAHASLLTGLWPSHHGVLTHERSLPSAAPTLAERLGSLGFDTGGFVNGFFVGSFYGFQRGFATFAEYPPDHSLRGAAPRILSDALDWLDRRRDRRFFLFIHLYDVHASYGARPEIETRFVQRKDADEGSAQHVRRLAARAGHIDPGELERISRLYDAGIRQLDGALGDFLDALDERGRFANTVVAITSDHGEEFGERGGVSHGKHLHREVLHVPLLLRGPGVPRGVRVESRVSLVDLAPTLLDLLGVGSGPSLDGRSLRAYLAGDPPGAERAIYAEGAPAIEGDSRAALMLGRDELLVDEARGRRELYETDTDPDERHDVAAARPELADRLAAMLGEHRAARPRSAPTRVLPEEQRQQLRALGYAVD